jgi:hypothetical protein
MNKEIVISASFKDLDWLNELHDIKKTIYRKGSEIKNENEIKIDINKGVAEHTYYYHIYHNYDNLSDLTFFCQDYPFDHWGNIIEIINNNLEKQCDLNINDQYFAFHNNTLGTSWNLKDSEHFFNAKILTCYSNCSPQHSLKDGNNVDMFWEILFSSKKPNKYEFIPGTHFGITKEQIKIRSKEFYKKVMDLLITHDDVPHIIERLNSYIFDNRFETKL